MLESASYVLSDTKWPWIHLSYAKQWVTNFTNCQQLIKGIIWKRRQKDKRLIAGTFIRIYSRVMWTDFLQNGIARNGVGSAGDSTHLRRRIPDRSGPTTCRYSGDSRSVDGTSSYWRSDRDHVPHRRRPACCPPRRRASPLRRLVRRTSLNEMLLLLQQQPRWWRDLLRRRPTERSAKHLPCLRFTVGSVEIAIT